jgi:WD40 repeat protein
VTDVRDGYRRWLYLLAIGEYAEEGGLPRLSLEREVRDVEAAFGSLGYEAFVHRPESTSTPHEIRRSLAEWMASKGPEDVVAIYVTGHGDVLSTRSGGELWIYTGQSRRRQSSEALGVRDLLVGLQDQEEVARVRNLLLVLDVCGAGAGLADAVDRAREAVPACHLEPGTATGVHIVATARAVDRAHVNVFSRRWRSAVESWDVAGRGDPYLDLPQLLRGIQDDLPQQVVEYMPVNPLGPNVCLANPRHHLTGVDADEMEEWWAPVARAAPRNPAHRRADDPRWMFTGRRRLNARLTAWVTGVEGPPVLVVTAAPGSGKSTVLARLVALTVPDFRHWVESGPVVLDAGQTPPPGFTFAATVWAANRSTQEVADRLRRALGLPPEGDLASLAERQPPAVLPVIAVDAVDEAREPRRLVLEVLRPLAQAAERGVLRLLVATRRHPVGLSADSPAARQSELITPLQLHPDGELLDLDVEPWREPGDIAAYADLLLSAPVNSCERINPYAGDAGLRRALARAIEEQSRHSFLLASLVARKHTLDIVPVDPHAPSWLRRFPRSIGEALRQEIDAAYGDDEADQIMALLRPLAFAHTVGLSRDDLGDDDLWAAVARGLSLLHGEPHVLAGMTARAVDDLLGRRISTHLVARSDKRGGTTYRFHHQALADSFHTTPDGVRLAHQAVARVLLDSLESEDGRDWSRAVPYLRRALPWHARQAELLPGLLDDGGFLTHCEPDQLHGEVSLSAGAEALPVRMMLRPLLHRLLQLPVSERAFLLALAALITPGAGRLSGRLSTWAGGSVRPGACALRSFVDEAVLPSSRGWVWSVATGHDRLGRPLVITGTNQRIDLWDPDTCALVDRIGTDIGFVTGLVCFTDEDGFPVLAAAGGRGAVAVWDLTTLTPRRAIPPNNGFGNDLALGHITPARPFLIGARTDRVGFWEPGSGRPPQTVPEPRHMLTGTAVVPRGKGADLVAYADGAWVRLWDPQDRRPLLAFECPDDLNVRLHGGGRHRQWGRLLITTGVTDGLAFVWNPDDGLLQSLPGDDQITCGAFATGSHGRPLLVLGHAGGAVRLLELDPPREVAVLTDAGPTIDAVALGRDADGGVLTAAVDSLHGVRVWDESGTPRLAVTPTGATKAAGFGQLRSEAPYLVGGGPGRALLWNLPPSAGAGDERLHRGTAHALTAFASDGRTYLATAADDGSVRIWDASGRLLHRLDIPPGYTPHMSAWAGAGTPDDVRLAVSTADGLYLFAPLTGRLVRHVGLGYCGSMDSTTGDGHRGLLAVAADRDIHVLDMVDGSSRARLSLPDATGAGGTALQRGNVTRLRWGSAGTGAGPLLAAGTDQGRVRAWHWRGSAPAEISGAPTADGPVLSLHFAQLPDATTRLAAGSRNGSLLLWDPGTGRTVADLSREEEWANGLASLTTAADEPVLTTTHAFPGGAALRVWDARTGLLRHEHTYSGEGEARCPGTVRDRHGRALTAHLLGDTVILHAPSAPESRVRLPLPVGAGLLVARDTSLYVAGAGGFLSLTVDEPFS